MLLVNNNKNIQRHITFNGLNQKNAKFYKSLYEDELDEFVSNVIRQEQHRVGTIYSYETPASRKFLKKYPDNLLGTIKTFILNNKLHLIKLGEQEGSFIDVTKRLK